MTTTTGASGSAAHIGPASRPDSRTQLCTNCRSLIGGTRPTRAADRIAPWIIDRATAHGEFDVEVLSIWRDWPLPIFSEHFGTIGDLQDPTYSEPIVKRWNQKIKDGEAYLVVTPEYNHWRRRGSPPAAGTRRDARPQSIDRGQEVYR